MLAFLIRRLGFVVFVVVGVTLLLFLITNVVPADPARVAAGLDAGEEQVEAMRKMLGLDKPLAVQYIDYVRNLLELDFGRSVRTRRPISEDIARCLPATIELMVGATVVYVVLGVPMGVIAAVKQGSFVDRMLRVGLLMAVATPEFWLALLAQVVFFSKLHILPVGGRLPIAMTPPPHITGLYTLDSLIAGNWDVLRASLIHLILPMLCLSVSRIGVLARVTRRGMITAMQEDYIRTARAKGLTKRIVVWRHAFPNVIIPVVTIIGLQAGWLLSQTLVVEAVFGWPGLGWYAVESIGAWDFLAVMTVALVISLSFVLINLATDVIYHIADPRLRARA